MARERLHESFFCDRDGSKIPKEFEYIYETASSRLECWCLISFQLAAILLTLVLVEGRMVTRREQNNKVVAEQAGELSKVEVEEEEEVNNRVARQAGEGEQEERQAGPFDLFGQVISSFGKKDKL